MFSLHDFILKGLKDAVGKMADHQVILNAAGWHEKGVLHEDDLAEINSLIDAKNAQKELEKQMAEEMADEMKKALAK